MSAHGSRFSGSYQFPRTDHARLERGQPIARQRTRKGEVMIVPLDGGRQRQYDVCATWTEGDTSINHTYLANTEPEARREFARLLREELAG